MGGLAGHLEIDLVWENISAAAAVQGHATRTGSASHWRLHVLDPAQAPSYGHRLFSLKVGDPHTCDRRKSLKSELNTRSVGLTGDLPKRTTVITITYHPVTAEQRAREDPPAPVRGALPAQPRAGQLRPEGHELCWDAARSRCRGQGCQARQVHGYALPCQARLL